MYVYFKFPHAPQKHLNFNKHTYILINITKLIIHT